MSNFFKFLTSKLFLINLVVAIVVLIMFFGFTYKWLDSYTNHGSTVTIPDLRGLKITDVPNFLKGKAIKFQVADSSVFDLEKPAGTIIEQDPSPNEKAKENRTVYLSITKTVPPRVKIPNLIDVSYRQAESILFSYGLKTGATAYKPDLCKNCVLAISVKGATLQPGDEVSKGTVIDLVLGDGFGNTQVSVPQLRGLTLDEALFVLKGSSLNAGAIIFDNTVRDSAQAFVYKQNPAFGDSSSVSQGEVIDIFLTQSQAVLKANTPNE